MLPLKSKDIKISTGGPLIAILNQIDAKRLDLQALDRIKISYGNTSLIVAVDISESSESIQPGKIGLFKEVIEKLEIKKKLN